MIISLTGHRPDKLGGYDIPNETYDYVCISIEKILNDQKPDKVISGLALGADTWFALIAMEMNIPVVAAIPFVGQESKWSFQQRVVYNYILSKVESKVIVSAGGYASYKLQLRNEYMVDNCDKLIAIYDGSKSGTRNCVEYAIRKNKEIILIDPKGSK